jgi:hypothetical protein
VAEHKLGHGLTQKVIAILLFLFTGTLGLIPALSALDFTIDNGTLGYRFKVGINHYLAPAAVVIDFNILDAVMTNINAYGHAFTANFSDQT